MANRLSLDCPIDGTSLAVNRPPSTVKLPPISDQGVGSHAHVEYDLTLTCGSGHQWRIVADVTIERVA